MVPSERGSVATAVSTPAADKLLHGPISGKKKCKKPAPRKIHKAEREKLKRDHLNDLFVELGNMLEADRQNNGKACILTDTTRILRELLVQVDSLRKEHSNLQNESHYVTMERNEMQDENSMLHRNFRASKRVDNAGFRKSSRLGPWHCQIRPPSSSLNRSVLIRAGNATTHHCKRCIPLAAATGTSTISNDRTTLCCTATGTEALPRSGIC